MVPKPVTSATLTFLPARMTYAAITLDILTSWQARNKKQKRTLDELLITNGLKILIITSNIGQNLALGHAAKILLSSEWLASVYPRAMIRLLLFAQRNKPGNNEEGHS